MRLFLLGAAALMRAWVPMKSRWGMVCQPSKQVNHSATHSAAICLMQQASHGAAQNATTYPDTADAVPRILRHVEANEIRRRISHLGNKWRRRAYTSSAPGRRGATEPTGGGLASCLTAAGTSSSKDPELAAQVENLTTKSSSGTTAITSTNLGSSMPAPPTEARP